MSTQPNPQLVFDVNVFIDAMDVDSRFHDDALLALANDNEHPAFISDTMLKTLANKLISYGADPTVVQEYVELILDDREVGALGVTLVENVPAKTYDITDRYGNPDYEDASVISLRDFVETTEMAPAVLVSQDKPLRDWCTEHNRTAVEPRRVPALTRAPADEIRLASMQYLARRIFRNAPKSIAPLMPERSSRHLAAQIVGRVQSEHTPPDSMAGVETTRELYRKYPELDPENRDASSPALDGNLPEL